MPANFQSEKGFFSTVDDDHILGDYDVSFKDRQCLEIFRHTLLAVKQRVANNANVIEMWQRQVQCHANVWGIDKEDSAVIIEKLQEILIHNTTRQKYVETLVDEVSGISKLISYILGLRNQKIQIQISTALHSNGLALKEIAENSKRENQSTAEINIKMQQDSRFVKILTLVALLYLPASLIATIFSSNLIQLVDDDSNISTPTHYGLPTQFWIYPVLVLALTISTLLPAMLCGRNKRPVSTHC